MDVHFIDTTFRDGSQSLWAMGIRYGMMEVIAEAMDHAGFDFVEVPANSVQFKKFIRDLKEDPWEVMRMLARKMPRTPKAIIEGDFSLNVFAVPTPLAVKKLFLTRLVETGAVNRVQLVCNVSGVFTVSYPWLVPMLKSLGVQVAFALAYTISPRHTDEYYAEKTRHMAQTFKPDVIYLKDQGGLLTLDRLRTLLPVILQNASGVPVELHSHCTTGLAPQVYMEALRLGVRTLHTAIPPLADGPGQPSVLSTARNARFLGYTPKVDEKILKSVSERLTAIAKQERMPIGAPLEYDCAQYVHQVPGGVISNLKYQLAELHLENRLDEVLEECVQIRKELGYPFMITPYSQYIATQAAINLATGERYKVVVDELIRFAQGAYGEESGYPWMDQNLRDRLLSMPRAAELTAAQSQSVKELSLKEVRESLGGPGVSDEELLLRLLMNGEKEIEAMRAAGPPKQYYTTAMPLLTLLQELKKHPGVRYLQVQRNGDSYVIQNRSGDGRLGSAERDAPSSGLNSSTK